jgi:hypothetical protein
VPGETVVVRVEVVQMVVVEMVAGVTVTAVVEMAAGATAVVEMVAGATAAVEMVAAATVEDWVGSGIVHIRGVHSDQTRACHSEDLPAYHSVICKFVYY